MGVACEVAHVIHGPALAFLNHQHFVFPALGALFQPTRRGILRASRLGMVGRWRHRRCRLALYYWRKDLTAAGRLDRS